MTLSINKACPVVLRQSANGIEILAFKHPLAGCQLVKGTVEPGESPEQAAVRELAEESGLTGTVAEDLGCWMPACENHHWAFLLMAINEPISERFRFYTQDDGGHWFEFFWHPLNQQPDNRWHPLFKEALAEIRLRL